MGTLAVTPPVTAVMAARPAHTRAYNTCTIRACVATHAQTHIRILQAAHAHPYACHNNGNEAPLRVM